MATEGSENKIIVSTGAIGVYSDPMYIVGSLACGGGKESYFNSGLVVQRGSNLTVAESGDFIMSGSGNIVIGSDNGESTSVTFKTGIIAKSTLTFSKGVLTGVNKGSNGGAYDPKSDITTAEAKAIVSALHGLTSGAIGTNRLGKLAWKDDVEISSASFNLGGSALSVGRPTISGDTATYQVTIPGQRYSAGSSERAHAYAWIDENDGLHVTCTTGSAPAGYNDSTNKKKAHDSCSAGSGGSGTTKNRTLTAKITVKAT